MATANRKQQREIEIAEKKVLDGVKEFKELWRKVEEAQDVKDRDRLMSDMKRELKRLQRLREQFRAWAEDSSIREHGPLWEMRRLVETQMERFKDLEKEAKIKPFAKAGLQQKEKVEPAVEAKMNCETWLRNCIACLAVQIEQFEADAEALITALDKKPAARVDELNGFIRRHKEQTTKLEQVLRLVENDQVSPAEVDETLKESMEHFLESSTEPDFVEDELMYQGFPLGEGLENVGRIQHHDAVRLPSDDRADSTGDSADPATPKDSLRAKASRTGSSRLSAASKRGQKPDTAKGAAKKSKGRSVATPASATSASAPPPPLEILDSAAGATTPSTPPGLPSQFKLGSPSVLDSCPSTDPPALATAEGSPEDLVHGVTPANQQIMPESAHQVTPPFLESMARHASYAKFSPSSPPAAPSSYKLGSPPTAGITPPSAGLDGQPCSWHLQNPDLAATLKGVRSSTTAQLLLDLNQAPTSPLLRAEQASAQALGPPAQPGRLRLRSDADRAVDQYLNSLSPARYAMDRVQGLELGIEEVASQLHGFDSSARTAEELQKLSAWQAMQPAPGSPTKTPRTPRRDSSMQSPAQQQYQQQQYQQQQYQQQHHQQHQLLTGKKSFAQAASQKEGVSTAPGVMPASESATGAPAMPVPSISDDPLLSPSATPACQGDETRSPKEPRHSILLWKLKEALHWEILKRAGAAEIADQAELVHPWGSINQADQVSLQRALGLLLQLEPQWQSSSQGDPVWAREAAEKVLGCLDEQEQTQSGSLPDVRATAKDGSEFAPQATPENAGSDLQPCALRRSSSLDLGPSLRLQPSPPPEPAGAHGPSRLLAGSLDSLETQLRGLAPIDVARRPGIGRATSMPSPVRSEGRRPRLDLSQASRSDTGGDRGTLGSGVPRSRAKRIHKTSTSPAHLEHASAMAAGWAHSSGSGPLPTRTQAGFGMLPFIPPPPPPRKDATRGTAASSLDSPSPGPHQPFLEREHQKPYYASNVRNPQEKALLAASKDAMPQDADRQYRTAQEPVSIFRQPRHKYNPATIRPVEWPLPSMWSSQVIPRLESPFFEEASQGKWPEAALFAFTFQPGTTQQMHAAELLKKQGWMFHSHFRKWFHRPNHPAQNRREVTETYEKGEWIFWEPRLDEDGEGWCAHQTNSDFCFEYDHLCKA